MTKPTLMLAGFVVLGLLARAPLAQANTQQITCYDEAYDADGDGYAAPGSPAATLNVDPDDTMVCPEGYVRHANDCDDTRATVHPYAIDYSGNGRDDNCNGRVDEPGFTYFSGGNGNSSTGFDIQVRASHADIYNSGQNLYAQVELASLKDSAHPVRTSHLKVLDVSPAQLTTTLSVGGLVAATPYRARVRFFKAVFKAGQLVLTNRIPTWVQLGPVSDWYYTTTLSAPGSDKTSRTRTKILLQGFKEYDDSMKGRVGYRGTLAPDGTRYGASDGEKWCSEFYVWLTHPWLHFMGAQGGVSELIDYFNFYQSFFEEADIPAEARRADYLPLDTDGDGERNHSAMFLAYDESTGTPRVWTLEGNLGNRVEVVERPFNDAFTGFGHLKGLMIK